MNPNQGIYKLPMKKVPYAESRRGNLIFYHNSRGTIIHIAIYLGNDQVIEAWLVKTVVEPIKNSKHSNVTGVMRPVV